MYLTGGMNYVVNSAVWLFLIAAAFFVGKQSKNQIIRTGSYVGFVCLTVYLYFYAWDVEWVTFLGIKYVPFANAGAIVWMVMAWLGFYFSKYEEGLVSVKKRSLTDVKRLSVSSDNMVVSGVLGVLSHFIVGGLLTVQIANLWEAYDIPLFSKNLALSISWIVYALIIYLMSAKSKHLIYRRLGGTVLILTSIKVFTYDLSGSATYQKVIFLMVIGGLTLIIGKVKGGNAKEVSSDNELQPELDSKFDS
jgi:hypothetical protein